MIESVIEQTVRGLGADPRRQRQPRRERAPGDREWSGRDARIRAIHRPVNGNISAATNHAAAAARGEFLVLLDPDDLLDPDALAHLAIHLDAHPETDLVYSDDDKIGADGRRHSPQFKPDWSPELLLSFCYLGPSHGHPSEPLRRAGRDAVGLRRLAGP